MPRLFLRLEGLVLFILATWAFAHTGQSWWLYGILFFSPDLSCIAYMVGAKLGAVTYNAAHTTVVPAALAAAGITLNSSLLVGLAAIWAAHIGFDRVVGYGLKYATAFSHTHLGRIGRDRVSA
jgi:hypothetical protein